MSPCRPAVSPRRDAELFHRHPNRDVPRAGPGPRCRGVCRRLRDRPWLDDESRWDGHRDHWTVGARQSAIDQLERNEAARNDRQRHQRSRDGPPGGSGVGFVQHRRRADFDPVAGHHPAVGWRPDADLQLFLAHTSNASTADYLRVTIVGATAAVVLQELGAANDDDAAWAAASVNLKAFAGQTIRMPLEAADAAAGSMVEARMTM